MGCQKLKHPVIDPITGKKRNCKKLTAKQKMANVERRARGLSEIY